MMRKFSAVQFLFSFVEYTSCSRGMWKLVLDRSVCNIHKIFYVLLFLFLVVLAVTLLAYTCENVYPKLPLPLHQCLFNFHVLKEPGNSAPTVVATGNREELFEANIQLVTQTDMVVTSRPTNIFDALCSVFCLYWVYDISYNQHLSKTLKFLGCHVLKIESAKTSVAMQRRLNVLYSL